MIDTPGIPNLNQCSAMIKDFDDMKAVMSSKRMISCSISVHQNNSVWLGALARLDVLSGVTKYYTFYMPPKVSIHRTPFERNTIVYERQAGN